MKMTDNPLVVFDLGNVLIRIADDWQHACRVAKVDAPTEWPLDEMKQRRLHEIVVANEIGQMDHEAFCHGVGELFQMHPAHIAAVSDAYLIAPFDGVDALLNDLSSRQIETACLSNTNASHWNLMLAKSGHASLPLGRLTYRFASQEVAARKPDEPIFEHLEKVTNRLPEQIVFFDDKLDNIETSRRRGWNGIQIDSRDPNPVVTMRAALLNLQIL